MIAYLIDPFARTMDAVDYDGDYHSIYRFIDARTYECARFNQHGDAVFIDEEGLINGRPQEFFIIPGYPTPLAGKGLVLGCNLDTGDSVAPHVDLNWLRERVMFVAQLAFLPTGHHGSR
jgi:hypothetical protein